jgi:DinB superfamily
MVTTAVAPEICILLRLLDESYEKKAWHGPNLRGSIRGIEVEEAAWRPGPGRHNIWENVVHAAYWKYTVRRRLVGEKKGSFPLKGSNWFVRPIDKTMEAWRTDVALLDAIHRSLRAAIAMLAPADLDVIPAGTKMRTIAVVTGIAAHDVYHAGQIQLLKRLARGAPGSIR